MNVNGECGCECLTGPGNTQQGRNIIIGIINISLKNVKLKHRTKAETRSKAVENIIQYNNNKNQNHRQYTLYKFP